MHHHLKPSQQLDSKRQAITALFHMNFMKLDSGCDFPKSQFLGSS